MDEQSATELGWLERDKLPIDGLDHLGVEGVSASVYSLLAPGISNLTERARYFALLPWALHRFAQAPAGTQTQREWRNWIRRVGERVGLLNRRAGPGPANSSCSRGRVIGMPTLANMSSCSR